MIVTPQDPRAPESGQVRAFLEGAQPLSFAAPHRTVAYEFMVQPLRRFGYARPTVRAPLYSGRCARARQTRACTPPPLAGPATRKLCAHAHTVFGDARYQPLATISNGPFYNLRPSNRVDEVTQFVDCVERIAERFLLPVLEALIQVFFFLILRLPRRQQLRKHQQARGRPAGELHIEQFTQSHARKTNDNALVESKTLR